MIFEANSVSLSEAQDELERQLHERLAAIQRISSHDDGLGEDPSTHPACATHRIAVEQISAALNRISLGTYGSCIRCARQITPARLKALPYAATCIECQSHADIG